MFLQGEGDFKTHRREESQLKVKAEIGATCPRAQVATGSRGKEGFATDPAEVCGPASFLIAECCRHDHERLNAYFKPPSLWYFTTAAVETITGRKTLFSLQKKLERKA